MMLGFGGIFRADGLDESGNPVITKIGYEDLGDDPDLHRWRAWWVHDVTSIELRAYPVIKKTRCGAWIDDLAWRQYCAAGREWNFSGDNIKGKFVYDDRQQSWAKATQEQAIESLAIRLCRWTAILERDTQKALAAADALLKLRPDLEVYANAAKKNLGDFE